MPDFKEDEQKFHQKMSRLLNCFSMALNPQVGLLLSK